MQINTNEVYLLVALIYMSEHQKATLFYGQAVQLISGALFTTYNWRTFVLVIGKFQRWNRITEYILKWGSFNAKEAFVFAQVSAYFPHFSVPQHVCAAASKNSNLRASKPTLQQLNFWCSRDSDADSLLPFSLSHVLLLMVEDDGSLGVREERRSRMGFVQRCSDL